MTIESHLILTASGHQAPDRSEEPYDPDAGFRLAPVKAMVMTGIAEAFVVAGPEGPVHLAGVRSVGSPHVLAMRPTNHSPGVVYCAACGEGESFPDPPSAISLGEKSDLFSRQSSSYATYLVAKFLNPFTRKHARCEPPKENA